MSSSSLLYARLFAVLRGAHPEIRVTRIANWVWVVVGLIQAQSVHLNQIACFVSETSTFPAPPKPLGGWRKCGVGSPPSLSMSQRFMRP